MRQRDGVGGPTGAFRMALNCLLAIGLLALTTHAQTEMVPTSGPPPGTSSLAFVFDITGSMFDDLVQVRQGAKEIFKTVMSQREKLIWNYILVPFHDPDLGTIINTTDSMYFQRQLNKVHVFGGGDCPEMTLTGIKAALELALPSSFIYVFTDARSKDYHLEQGILDLIQEKQSSVVFVMTGDCGNRTHPGFRTYEKIAAASFGQVFHLQKADVSKVLEYVRHAVVQKKVHIMFEARDHGGSFQEIIPVDKGLTELTLSLSGDKADDEVLDITLKDPSGKIVDKNLYNKEGGTIDLKNVKLIRLKDPKPGKWTVMTRSTLKHTLRIFGHGNIDFKYGFGNRPNINLHLLNQRPVANQPTYLMVNMSDAFSHPATVTTIELVDIHGESLEQQTATQSPSNPRVYFIGPFIPPKSMFFVKVLGTDAVDYEFQRIAPTAIGATAVGGPKSHFIIRDPIPVGTNANLTCEVESHGKYQVFWRLNGRHLAGPLFFGTSDVSVWQINGVTSQDEGKYECVVVSENGNSTSAAHVKVVESLPIFLHYRNETVVLDGTAFLHCQTQSVTTVQVRWLHRGIPVRNDYKHQTFPNGTLSIRGVSRAEAGSYVCQAKNSGGMSSQKMHLKVYELPEAEVEPKEFYFKTGSSMNMTCRIAGDPFPEAQWFHNGVRITPGLNRYITLNNELVIRNPEESDRGQYECRAVSSVGHASDTAEALLATLPNVRIMQSKSMIGRGDNLTLECIVESGSPPPNIIWFRNSREVMQSSHDYVRVDGNRLHISGAQDSDAGSYSCVAENIAGRDIQVVKVNVGSIPTIVNSLDVVPLHIDKQGTLPCIVIGHPTPTVTWKRNGIDIKDLPDHERSKYAITVDNSLFVHNVTFEDQARFTCVAKNEYGEQSKMTNVVVTGMQAPVLGKVPPEEQLISGQDLRLTCVVIVGVPRPDIVWYKDGQLVEATSDVIIENGGTSLLLRDGKESEEGHYTCTALSPAGNASINVHVQLIKPPYIPAPHMFIDGEEVGLNVKAKDAQPVRLACDVDGNPPPVITWFHNSIPVSYSSGVYSLAEDKSLMIHRMSANTAGHYLCTAENTAGSANVDYDLQMYAAPLISKGLTVLNVIEDEVEDTGVFIPCQVSGEPAPKIEWTLNGGPLPEGVEVLNDGLQIDSVKESHTGFYQCVAINEGGRAEKNTSVVVHIKPTIGVAENQLEVTVNPGQPIELACPASASPPPERTWTFMGRPIDFVDGSGTLKGTKLTLSPEGTLTVSSALADHTGLFMCHVSNLAGDDSLFYDVKINEPPRIVSPQQAGTIDIVVEMALEIPCEADGAPTPEVQWEKDGLLILRESDSGISVNSAGTLRIANSRQKDAGVYTCRVTNAAGSEKRDFTVVVQEPPKILPSTLGNYTAVAEDKVEMRCMVSANPIATIEWLRKGNPIRSDHPGITIQDDGTLVIDSVLAEDATIYTCRATNPAGMAEKNIRLSVVVPPEMRDEDVVDREVVKIDTPFALYCPVVSAPLPQITWYLDDKPIAELDPNIAFSEDKRKISVMRARTIDAGVYKCTARNSAGESSKSFEVEVTQPPYLDESRWKRKVTVNEGNLVELGCPVSGIPPPTIVWIFGGAVLEKGTSRRGATASDDGKTITINMAEASHEGDHHCIASNKAGSLDVDIALIVKAPPKMGQDQRIELVEGKAATLNCDYEGEDDKTTVAWTHNGSPILLENVQVPQGGKRLFIMDTKSANAGEYECTVTNNAGSKSKRINVDVLIPPQFAHEQSAEQQNVMINLGNDLPLSCIATGSPAPTTQWMVDGVAVTGASYGSDDQSSMTLKGAASGRYTCIVENKAGRITRDFFVQIIAPPKITDDGSRMLLEITEGQTGKLECPVESDSGDFQIEWWRSGRQITAADASLATDSKSLVIFNAKKEHEEKYTCVATNKAGKAVREFEVVVLSPPRIETLVEAVEVVEGAELTLNCDAEGSPAPAVTWTKDGSALAAPAQVLNENKTMSKANATGDDAGVYKCALRNKAGAAEKTFNVRVVQKPDMGDDAEVVIEVLITRPVTFDCPVKDPIGVELSWKRKEIPATNGMDNVQILAGGRHLHIAEVRPEDEGKFSCEATNGAGTAKKNYRLVVLVPPTISNQGGEYNVIENNSLVLPCEVSKGYPVPEIKWTKDGKPTSEVSSISVMGDGEHIRISQAVIAHKGTYSCHVSNKVGNAEISFDVDVITRPSITTGIQEVIEVVQGETAYFRCPVADRNFKEIDWQFNGKPIVIADETRFTVSQEGKKLHLQNASLTRDEGTYTCRIKNDAGVTPVNFKLSVLVPPEIIMLDKDKNRSVLENAKITLSCPATGKPEPEIAWLRDGEILTEANIADFVKSGSMRGNEIVIARVNAKDAGRYTCEAKNKAGTAEQEVIIDVLTKPHIEREGIPSEISELADKTVTLACPVYGKPTPTVKWLRAGQELSGDSAHYKISANGQKLYLLKLRAEDFTSYTCIAKNSAGEVTRDFSIKMLEPPAFDLRNFAPKKPVNEGKPVILDCPATGSPPPTITWLKDGQSISTKDGYIFTNDGKNLHINEAKKEHQGRYTCLAQNEKGSVDLEQTLQVISVPVIDGPESEVIDVISNQGVDLLCEVNDVDSEQLRIEWQKDGKTISFEDTKADPFLQMPPSGRRLHLVSARDLDKGTYSCIAHTDAGDDTKTFHVNVLVPPTIDEVLSAAPITTALLDSTFTIECDAHGEPRPTITWMLDDKPVVETDNVQLAHDNSSLIVNRASTVDVGRYTCTAANAAGSVSRDFIVRLTAPPVFDQGEITEELHVGDFLELTCSVSAGQANLSTSWIIDGNPASDGTYSSTVEVKGNKVIISAARLSDSGSYVCVAKNDAGTGTKTFNLAVQETPRFLDMTNTKPSIIVGRPLVLDCSMTGTPRPTIEWRKDGEPIVVDADDEESRIMFVNERQSLHIEQATLEDSGRYSCVATNKRGSTEKDLLVNVLQPPRMAQLSSNLEVKEGDTRSIQCMIDGEPDEAEIRWTKNGIPITTSTRVQLSLDSKQLHILNAEPSDGAEYTCTVTNAAGSDAGSTKLDVLVAPKLLSPEYQSIEVVLDNTAELTCEASGTPAPTVEWHFDGKPVFEDDNVEIVDNGRILRLKGIQAHREGRYSCKAENKVGAVEGSTFLKVNAPPRATIPETDRIVKVKKGEPRLIKCEASGDPAPEVEWTKDGAPIRPDLVQTSLNQKSLYIKVASMEDAGKYTCRAHNSAGDDADTVELQVLVAPTIEDGGRVIGAKENGTIEIPCLASGHPAPLIAWTKDGKTVEGETGSTLRIPIATASDAGRFTCTARNEAGSAKADFVVDVWTKPRFKDLKTDIKGIEGQRATLECKVEGHPTPTITWYRSGRLIADNANVLVSPRGETLLILKSHRSDAGDYSCRANNLGGESEAQYRVTVQTPPQITVAIDQSPRVFSGKRVQLNCSVEGNPPPTIEWQKDGITFVPEGRFTLVDGKHLEIDEAKVEDIGRYVCIATNEAGQLKTEFLPEIIAKPQFTTNDQNYEVIQGDTVTMTCGATAAEGSSMSIQWFRGDGGLEMTGDMSFNADATQLTMRNVDLKQAGKYRCEATNEAGSATGSVFLMVFVPPRIDESNIIGNPLSILGQRFALECPVTGIPPPTIEWFRKGVAIEVDDERFGLDQSNQTLHVDESRTDDAGDYTCVATNKGGRVEQAFNLEVLIPPEMDRGGLEIVTVNEGQDLTLSCPVKPDNKEAISSIEWVKDGRPVDATIPNARLLSEGRRLVLSPADKDDRGNYTCVAQNRAGEGSADFTVIIMSQPVIETSKIDTFPKANLGLQVTMECPVSGHPAPTVKWRLNGQDVDSSDRIKISPNQQALNILVVEEGDAGRWMCLVENDAGYAEQEFTLDVWIPPTVAVSSQDGTVKNIGESVVLTCNATGNPAPVLTWHRGGNPLKGTDKGIRIGLKGSRLDIPKLTKDEVGDYTCHVSNEAGNADASVFVDVRVPPEIDRTALDMAPKVHAGELLTLTCKENVGKPKATLKWLINDTTEIAEGERFTLGLFGETLQIANISMTDSGRYSCVATNAAGSDTLIYDVTIVQPPQMSPASMPIQVIEGDTAKINCGATGTPKPVISWIRNGVRIEAGVQQRTAVEEQMITIIEARSTDSGIYVCQAENEAGRNQQAYTLEVLVLPKITKRSDNETTAPTNKLVSLECESSGSPDPFIKWYIDDELIDFAVPSTAKIFSYKNKTAGTAAHQVLSILGAPKKLQTIRCEAVNDAGKASAEFLVKSISAPTVLKDGTQEMNITEGMPAYLHCGIDADSADISWFKDDYKFLPSANEKELSDDKTAISFKRVTLSDQGLYKCVVRNAAGEAEKLTQLYVGTPPRITEFPEMNVFKQGTTVMLKCEATGIPQPKITWFRDDIQITETAVGRDEDKPSNTMIFDPITPDKTGPYKCRADNWAGTVYQQANVYVQVPPRVFVDRMNYTVNLRDSVTLDCEGDGNPEPMTNWIRVQGKDAGKAIVFGQKYQEHGRSLIIHNVNESDAGHYHCVLKSEAGQSLGTRTVAINGGKSHKSVWVECDADGNPLKVNLVMNRGDAPGGETEDWDSVTDTSSEQDYHCLPNNDRGARALEPQTAPHFLHTPINYTIEMGKDFELYCSAIGSPMPKIYWLHNGTFMESPGIQDQHSILRITVSDPLAQSGDYECVATNDAGTIRSMSTQSHNLTSPDSNEIDVDDEDEIVKKRIAVFRCGPDPKGQYYQRARWYHRNVEIDRESPMFNVMANGTLVVLNVLEHDDESLKHYTCKWRNRRPHDLAVMEVEDVLATVSVPEDVINASKGEERIIDCVLLKGQPLTTKIQWIKNGERVREEEEIRILPNNSLWLKDVMATDSGDYSCRASSPAGNAYDDVHVAVEKKLPSIAGGEEQSQNLVFMPTDSPTTNEVTVVIEQIRDADPKKHNLLKFIAHPPINSDHMPESPKLDRFNRTANYKFETGERMTVRQRSKGKDTEGYIRVETDVEGEIPWQAKHPHVRVDASRSEFTEAEDGEITGHGKSKIRLGEHEIPFDWDEVTNYDPEHTGGRTMIPPGKTYTIVTDAIANDVAYSARGRMRSGCPKGYVKKGKRCYDIDECDVDEDPCEDGSACVNIGGGFDCVRDCPVGFRVRWDGSCADIDECTTERHECSELEQCRNTEGSYECLQACDKGFRVNDNGFCDDIDECLTEPCSDGLRCHNTLGSFTCLCPGAMAPVNGKCPALTSSNRRPKKIPNRNRGRARQQKKPACQPGYERVDGECVDIDECKLNMPCDHHCENTDGGYECVCPEGYTEEEGRCRDIDECASSPCPESTHDEDFLCFNTYGGHECLENPCPEHYRLNDDNDACIPDCQGEEDCEEPIINLSLFPFTSNKHIGSTLAKLSAVDTKDHHVRNNTMFSFETEIHDYDHGATRDGPFALRMKGNYAELYLAKTPEDDDEFPYFLNTRARSLDVPNTHPDIHRRIIVGIGEYPF